MTMTPKNRDDLDARILAALRRYGRCGTMTYVVKNCVRDFGRGPKVETPLILRRLKRMEKAGIVERAPTNYLVQICWREAAPFAKEG